MENPWFHVASCESLAGDTGTSDYGRHQPACSTAYRTIHDSCGLIPLPTNGRRGANPSGLAESLVAVVDEVLLLKSGRSNAPTLAE